jgi:hypothetical protein
MRFMSYRKACDPAEVSNQKKKNSFNQLLTKFSRITTEDTKNQNIQQKLSKQLLTKVFWNPDSGHKKLAHTAKDSKPPNNASCDLQFAKILTRGVLEICNQWIRTPGQSK